MLSIRKLSLFMICILGIIYPYIDAYNPYYLRKEKAESQSVLLTKNEFPFIVGVYANLLDRATSFPKCLGIILNSVTILTSASCVHDIWGNAKTGPQVFVIRHSVREGCDTHQSYEPRLIRNTIIHQDFNFTTRQADLAFLISYERLTLDNSSSTDLFAKRSSLNLHPKSKEYVVSYETVPVGTKCMFFGYLLGDRSHANVQRLSHSNVEVEELQMCIEAYAANKNIIHPDKYCAGVPSKSVVPTFNDTGGPLLCDANIVGITSRTSINGTHPGVYTRLSDYKKFIRKAYKYDNDMQFSKLTKMKSGVQEVTTIYQKMMAPILCFMFCFEFI